jgi:hypothetical protein
MRVAALKGAFKVESLSVVATCSPQVGDMTLHLSGKEIISWRSVIITSFHDVKRETTNLGVTVTLE